MTRADFVAELLNTWEDLRAYEEQLAAMPYENRDEAELHAGAAKELAIAIRTLELTYSGTELGIISEETDLPLKGTEPQP